MLYLNNIPASDVGVVVAHRPRRPVPRRETLSWTVPGRGKIFRELDRWENITLQYELSVLPLPGVSLAATADLAVAWLSQSGYMRLYDDTDPDVFYLAAFTGGTDLEPVLHRARRARVSFDARPERFLLSGDELLVFAGAGVLVNPTAYTARPQITLRGSGSGTLTVAGKSMTLAQCGGRVIDADTKQVSGSASVSGSFPEMPPGSCSISFSGGISSVEILPRWFMI